MKSNIFKDLDYVVNSFHFSSIPKLGMWRPDNLIPLPPTVSCENCRHNKLVHQGSANSMVHGLQAKDFFLNILKELYKNKKTKIK